MRAKDDLRRRAVELRRAGLSYNAIREELDVSKSTLSLWLRDVPLTDDQRTALAEAAGQGARSAVVRARKAAERQAVVAKARAQVTTVSERELFVAGLVAYWAEGSKEKPWSPGAQVQFMNSDADMIRLFLRWLALVGVDRDRLVFRVSIHESADVRAAERFWADVVGVDVTELRRSTLKRHNPTTVRRNTGRTYVGCLCVTVRRSSALLRQITGWWQGLAGAPVA